MNTPTPKTQSLWLKHVHFANEEEADEALAEFRDLCALLECENIALREGLAALESMQTDPTASKIAKHYIALFPANTTMSNTGANTET